MFGEKQPQPQQHHESRLGFDLFLDMIGVHGPYGESDDEDYDEDDDEELFI